MEDLMSDQNQANDANSKATEIDQIEKEAVETEKKIENHQIEVNQINAEEEEVYFDTKAFDEALAVEEQGRVKGFANVVRSFTAIELSTQSIVCCFPNFIYFRYFFLLFYFILFFFLSFAENRES